MPLTLCLFLSSPLKFMSCTKKEQTMARSYVRRKFYSMNSGLSISCYLKRNKKVKRSKICEPICAAIFTHKHTCVNKPCWQRGEIIILWKWQWSRGAYSILDVFLFIIFVIFLELKEKQRRKKTATEIQKYRNILGELHHFLAASHQSCVTFCWVLQLSREVLFLVKFHVISM